MASKKSFFNKTIYWKNLKRFYPWAAVYGLMLFFPSGLLQILLNLDGECDCVAMQGAVFSSGTLGTLILPVAALLAGSLLFQYLYQGSATQMLHALPVSREAHWISTFLAGLTLLELPLLLVCGFCAAYAFALGFAVMIPMLLKLFGAYALAILFYFGMVSFCVQLAGSSGALLVLFGLLNSLAAWVSLLRYALCSLFYPSIYPELFSELVARLTPVYYLLARTMDYNWSYAIAGEEVIEEFLYSIDLIPYLWYALAGVMLMLLGLLLYQRRHLERAGDALAFSALKRPLQILFATLTGLPHALMFRAEINLDATATVVVFILGGAVGYFVLGMLIDKTVHVFKTGWKGYAIFALLTILISVAAQTDVLGVASRIPDADEVASVAFSYYGDENVTDADLIAETIALHEQILEEYDALSQRRDNDIDELITICYTMKDGTILARHYTIYIAAEDFDDEDSVVSRYYSLTNAPTVILSTMFSRGLVSFYYFDLEFLEYEGFDVTWNGYIDLYEEEAQLVGQAFLQDIEAGNLLWNGCALTGSRSTYLTENHTYCDAWIEIAYYTEDGDTAYVADIQLDAGMTHIVAALDELGLLTEEYKAYLGM